jgi:hypothetical protein
MVEVEIYFSAQVVTFLQRPFQPVAVALTRRHLAIHLPVDRLSATPLLQFC